MGILRNARMAYTGGKLATKLALPCAVAKKLSCYLPSFVYSNVPYQARYGLDVLGMLNPREWNDLIDMLLAELDPETRELVSQYRPYLPLVLYFVAAIAILTLATILYVAFLVAKPITKPIAKLALAPVLSAVGAVAAAAKGGASKPATAKTVVRATKAEAPAPKAAGGKKPKPDAFVDECDAWLAALPAKGKAALEKAIASGEDSKAAFVASAEADTAKGRAAARAALLDAAR